jgi:hypothetical protein
MKGELMISEGAQNNAWGIILRVSTTGFLTEQSQVLPYWFLADNKHWELTKSLYFFLLIFNPCARWSEILEGGLEGISERREIFSAAKRADSQEDDSLSEIAIYYKSCIRKS